ncbi:hypothetical protein H6CHR_02624 [Variovorax sp. PBL-H6]|uniref:hypothetical protein n=1 Tax=Variovorax sp. PBL-H6 TaxID=434009 RepID=UPI00131937CA|nr:hypothetical protein [Variovorax sp. PBL-H6]VTU26581.1 hypothetical protein H6CHR_02624 [Variovorax sp. PBL-H6]
MGKKIGNNNPPQSFESLAHAFQGVMDSPEGKYLVAEKTKDKCEIDGVERGDITYLSQKKAKHGAAAAAYRLSGRRQNDYKEARIYLEQLAYQARQGSPEERQVLAAQRIQRVLATSKSKGVIKMKDIRNDVEIIINGVKATTEKSAEALKTDLRKDDDSISHFLDDVEAIKSGSISKAAAHDNVKDPKNKVLLGKIRDVNRQANSLGRNQNITSRLKLKRPSFTASASSTAGEMTGKNFLDKIANWPGPDLQQDLAHFFACAKSESSDQIQLASKKLLLSLAEQESILNLFSNEIINTIEDDGDRRKLQNLRDSAKQLLSEFRNPHSPFGRLKRLALAGYHWPKETAKQVVSKRDEFFQSLIGPIAGDPAAQQPANVQPAAQPVVVQPAAQPVVVQPAVGNGQPLPDLPPIPHGPPPPLPGVAGLAPAFDYLPPPLPVPGGVSLPPDYLLPLAASTLPVAAGGSLPLDDEPPPAPHLAQAANTLPVPGGVSLPPDYLLPLAVSTLTVAAGGSLPLDDEPPPAPQLAQAANTLPVAAGVSLLPDDEPPLAPHLAQPASVPPLPNVAQSAPGKFVAKRVAQYTNPSPDDHTDALPPSDIPPPPGTLSETLKNKLGMIDLEITQAIAEMNRKPEVLYASKKVQDAAELDRAYQISLAKTDLQSFLSINKADDGKGYRVVNATGEVNFLKVKELKERRIDPLKRHRRSQIKKAKLGFQALLENAKRTETSSQNLERIKKIQDWIDRPILLEEGVPVEVTFAAKGLLQKDAFRVADELRAEQMKIIAAPWKESVEPDINIRALMGGGNRQNFYDRLRARFLEKKDGKLQVVDTGPLYNHEDELAKTTGIVMNLGVELDAMLSPLRRDPEFAKQVELWVPEQRSDVGLILEPMKALDQFIRNAISAYDPLFSSNMKELIEAANPQSKANFGHEAEGVQRGITYRIARLQAAERLFLNGEISMSSRPAVALKMRELGEALRELNGMMLDPEGPFAALYRLCDIGVADPSKGKSLLYAAVTPMPPTDLPPAPPNGDDGTSALDEPVQLPNVA